LVICKDKVGALQHTLTPRPSFKKKFLKGSIKSKSTNNSCQP
jgi:hypothetical protein